MALHFATLPRGRRGKRAAVENSTGADSPHSGLSSSPDSELFHLLLEAGLDRHFAALNRRLQRPTSPSELQASLSSRRFRDALRSCLSVEEIQRLRQRLTSEQRRRSVSLMGRALRRLLPGGSGVAQERTRTVASLTLPKATGSSSSTIQAVPTIPEQRLRMGGKLSKSLRQASWLPCGESGQEAAVPVAVRATAVKLNAASIEKLFSLKHRSIAGLLGLAEETDAADQILLVMELAPFGSLLDCLQERRLRALLHPGVLCSLAQQLAEAMSYLENRSQPHGHLSASRVLVFALDRVKLVHPAGLNSGWDEKSPGTFLSRHEVWPAPETSQGGGSPSISADVWSFGVTLWEMFSYGRRPSPLSDYASQLPACPDACPARLYRDVMLSRCWQLEPTRRASFSQLALHLPKILPERRIATRNQPKLLPNDLELHLGDVIVVLDDDRNSDDGYQRCFGARIPSEEFEIDDKDLGNDVIAVGRFNWSTTAPLDPGAATTPATKGTLSSRVTRRATLSSSYAREFGQKISRFKKAAQSRLLHQSPLTPGSSDLRLEQHQQDAEAPASDLLCPHPRRRRVTSDMISEPTRTEFRHAGHVGADGTVFGDVSCLAELELTPTCEPPPPQQQQLAEEVAADASDSASSIVYRRRQVSRQVESLCEQSGYCRLGSSLSLGVDSVGVASSAASIEDDYRLDGDEVSTSDGVALLDAGDGSDHGTSLIDEIMQAWGSATACGGLDPGTESSCPIVAEKDDSPENAPDNQPVECLKVQAMAKTSDKDSFSDCSHCSTNSGCCTDARCAERTATTPMSSVSSLNEPSNVPSNPPSNASTNAAGNAPSNEPSNVSRSARQPRQHNCTSALFCSSPISISPVCSSSVSSLDSPVSQRAEAAAHSSSSRIHHHHKPQLLQPPPPLLHLAAVNASEARTVESSLIGESGAADYEEDIVNM